METRHIVSEPVRAYLLGQLGDQEAVALEEKYFMDRSFFLRVQSVEQWLIEDYLENRLSQSERQQFESRYLKIPALRKRLEEVRSQAPSLPAPKPENRWILRAAFATCLICVVGASAWIYVHQHRAGSAAVTKVKPAQDLTSQRQDNGMPVIAPADNGTRPPVVANAMPAKPPANVDTVPPATAKVPDDLDVLTVNLTPRTFNLFHRNGEGTTNERVGKGAIPKQSVWGNKPDARVITQAGGVEFHLPAAGGSIRFVVELGGATSVVFCNPRISLIGPDGRYKEIWTSGYVASVPANGGQELTFVVDSSVFHPGGYYALQPMRANGDSYEFYPFHVTGPR